MSILFITQQKYDHINFMAIDTSFEHYAVSHDKNGSGGGSTVIRGNIKNTNIPSDLQVTSITAARGNINNLHGTSESFNDAEFVYLTTSEGKILKIKGDELNYTIGSIDELNSGKITTDSIKSNDLYSTNAVIDALNSTNITTEYLTVTKQAHFFELVIDKVKSVGGSLIITGANSVIAYVKAFDSNNVEVPMFESNGDPIAESTIDSAAAYFKVYWIGKDENTGRENEDEWYVGDQAYCQSFSAQEGTNFDVSNKYYWRKVIGHESPVYMNLKTGEELQSGQSELYNEVYINTPTLSYTVDGTTYNVNKGWNVAVQQMSEVTWTPDSSVIDGTTRGTMGTKGTTFGIQLTPNTSTGSIQDIVPETFSFTCDKSRLGVGFVYQDGSYEWFAAPEQGQSSYVFSLTTSTPIDTVIIINADEVEWKLVRGIILSNTIKDSALTKEEGGQTIQIASSIPSIGDNITQLGHRYNEADSELGQNTDAAKERGSAIIIAAYHTPDKGETINGTYKRGLTPPSYAQYKLINDFYLTRFRHTFFDAKGSAFYGNFYAGTDTSGYDELEAGTPELFVAYAEDNGQGQADPNNWTKTPDSTVTYDFMGYATATVPPGSTREAVEQTLQFSDYDWNMVPSATGIPGRNGSYTQYAYKNAARGDDISIPTSDATYPPTGWSKTASTPPDGQYTWCIERTIIYTSNNTIDYTKCPWSSAYRISGSNGQQGPQGNRGPRGTDGSDGTDFEFIYTRSNSEKRPAAPVYDSNNDPVNTQDDWYGTDDHGIVWTDHPMGVQSDLKYEFMVQRSKPAGQQTWNAYAPNPAALWSKYGENGRDGDGVEYIYACVNDINTNPPLRITSVLDQALANIENNLLLAGANYSIIAWRKYPDDNAWKYVTDNDYVPPSKKVYHTVDSNYPVAGYYPDTDWTDDPQELNATDKKVEYVAQRKYNGTTKTWTNFSTPEIWAMYGGTGPQGPQGNPGPQGANGTGYKLVNVGSKASYSVTLDSSNDTDIDFDTYFNYKIARIINGEVHYLTAQERDNFIINGVTYLLYPYVKLKDTTQSPAEDKWYKLVTVSQDVSGETCFYSFGSNGLTTAQKETFINNNQLFEIALIPIVRPGGGQSAPTILDPDDYATEINNALDKQEIKLTITSSAQLQIVEGDGTNAPSIKALVTGQQGLSNNVSSLSLSVQGIQTRVDDLEDGFGGIQSQINQLPDEIEMSVYDTINQQTGIDITNGKISLNANNTEINGGLLTVNTGSGIAWTDQNGDPKINIHAGNLVGNFSSATEAISYSSKGTENMINLSSGISQRTGTITKEWIIQTNYNMLGKLPQGATISVSGITASCRIDVGTWEYSNTANHIQSKLELIYDSTVIATDIKNITSLSSQSGTVNHSKLSTIVGSEQTSGVWKIRATIDLNNANINIRSIYGAWCYGQWSNGSYEVNFGTAQDYKVLEMANDGIDFYTSGSDHMKFQQDNFELTTGKSGIKIDDTNAVPLQKASNGGWVTNGNILRVKDLLNSTGDVLSNDYDLYLYTQNSIGDGEHKFNLSTSNVPIGRTVYFKSTAQNINLINSTIVLGDSTGIKSSCNIGTRFTMAVWTGSYWLVHY